MQNADKKRPNNKNHNQKHHSVACTVGISEYVNPRYAYTEIIKYVVANNDCNWNSNKKRDIVKINYCLDLFSGQMSVMALKKLPGVHEFVFNLGKLVKREKGEIGTIP